MVLMVTCNSLQTVHVLLFLNKHSKKIGIVLKLLGDHFFQKNKHSKRIVIVLKLLGDHFFSKKLGTARK